MNIGLVVVAEYGVAIVALVAFVAGYVVSSRGRALRTPEGRHMINFRSSLAVFLSTAVVHRLVGPYAGRDLVAVAVVGWFMLAALGGVWLMVRAQLELRRRLRREAQEATTERGISAPRY